MRMFRQFPGVGAAFLTLAIIAVSPLWAGDLYSQPPFDEAELTRLIADFPRFRAWAKAGGQRIHPTVAPDGRADFFYSPQAAAHAESLGWNARRFFCVMGRAAAAVAVIEQGTDITANRPPDMPEVTPGELRLVRENLSDLLRAVAD